MILPDGNTVVFTVPEGLVSLVEFVPIIEGEYTITVFDVNAGPSCTESFNATIEGSVTLEIAVEAIIPPSEPTSMDGAIVIVVTMPGTLPYDIFLNGDSWGVAIADVFTIGGLGAGDYTVQIQDANGCMSNILFVTVPLPGSLGLEFGFGLGMMQSGPSLLPEQPKTAGHTSITSFVDVGLHYTTGGIKHVSNLAMYGAVNSDRLLYRVTHLVELCDAQFRGMQFNARGGLSVDMTKGIPVNEYLTIQGSASKRIGRILTAHATLSLRGSAFARSDGASVRVERPMIAIGIKVPVTRMPNLHRL